MPSNLARILLFLVKNISKGVFIPCVELCLEVLYGCSNVIWESTPDFFG